MDEKMVGVVEASEKLGVCRRTVTNACTRLRIGSRMSIGSTGRYVYLLSANDIEELRSKLQFKLGRPYGNANEESGVDPRKEKQSRVGSASRRGLRKNRSSNLRRRKQKRQT